MNGLLPATIIAHFTGTCNGSVTSGHSQGMMSTSTLWRIRSELLLHVRFSADTKVRKFHAMQP